MLIPVLFILLLPLTVAISAAGRRVETTFLLVTTNDTCPRTISHRRISLYPNINPSDREAIYEGFLWSDLLVDDAPCTQTDRSLHSTYLEPRATAAPDAPASELSPWFMIGRDNSPRQCTNYASRLLAKYYFTMDLPRFREHLIEEKVLPSDVGTDAKRGVVYMFSESFSEEGTLRSTPCIYIDTRDAQSVVEETPQQQIEESEPACLAGDVKIVMANGNLQKAALLSKGDQVAGERNAERVVSFSHADSGLVAKLVKLEIGIYKVNRERRLVSLRVTRDHLLLGEDGVGFAAHKVHVGKGLRAVNGVVAVVQNVSFEVGKGVFAPVVSGGKLIVEGGVVISCYSKLLLERTAHALLTPVRAFEVPGVDWGLLAADFLRDVYIWGRWKG